MTWGSLLLAVKIQRSDTCYELPSRRDRRDAGWDCYAAENATVPAGGMAKVSLGFSMELPADWAALLLPRSGLAVRGITLSNAPGLIDSSYRGLVAALVSNYGSEPLEIARGDRICQMAFLPVPNVSWQETQQLSVTERGAGGFGSTGL
ncbi:MAG: dUTP diphosphatase [Cyanobacteria bacterium P01_E01_bin.48]